MSGKYALIIGNTEYTDPGLAQLTAPGKDAEDFARVLKEKDLGAFDLVNVLVNEPSATVIEAIDEFFDQKKPDDLLVLYFSGHGVKDQLGSLYLAFKNTIRSRLRATAIKSDYISEAMDQSRSKRQVLILDCCNSGAFPPGTKSEVGGAMGMTRAFQGYGRFVLTASNAIQFAFEGDRFIGEAQNSLLTHFLVKGLEGEADLNSDGSITVDELYDYAYEQISRITPEQTPTKSASKQEGEIILRQNMRIEDIKPVSLPDDLIGDIDDLRPLVREGAVQRLEKILRGKNIGMARSAIEALEKVAADENTTRRVSQLAMQILESYLQAEKKVEEERKAREEAERLAALKAEEERLARETAEAERKAKEEAEKLARAQAEREAAEREAARLKAEREATELAAREAAEKAAREKTEKEAAEREAARLEAERKAAREKAEHEDAQKAEHEAMELASRRKAEREAAERAEREAIQLAARRKAEREAADKGVVAAGKTAGLQPVLQELPILKWGIIGIIGLCVLAGGTWGISKYLAGLGDATPTEGPVTEAPATEASRPEATEAPPEPGEKIQIRWFVGLGNGTQESQIAIQEEVVSDFNASQDRIELLLEVADFDSAPNTLLTQIASGNGPDIVGPVGWVRAHDFYGEWLDLTPYIAEYGFDTSNFEPALIEHFQTEEGQVSLPFIVFPAATYYVPRLFDEAGLDYPPSRYSDSYTLDGRIVEWNWDTLTEVARRLTIDTNGFNATDAGFNPNKIVQVGLGFQWQNFSVGQVASYRAGATDFVSGDSPGNYNVAFPNNWKEAMRWYYDGMWGDRPFMATGPLAGAADFGNGNIFNSGKGAMAITPLWYTCCIDDLVANGNDFQIGSLPIGDDGQIHGRVDADSFRILKDTQHPSEAFEVFAYLIAIGAEKLAPAYGGLPALPSQMDIYFAKLVEQYPSVNPESWDIFKAGLAFPDNPSSEQYQPNFIEANARFATFMDLLNNTPGLNFDAEFQGLVDDLNEIYNSP